MANESGKQGGTDANEKQAQLFNRKDREETFVIVCVRIVNGGTTNWQRVILNEEE